MLDEHPLCFHKKKIPRTGLPNLGFQITCAQNWYIAVQEMDLIKCPQTSGKY